MDSIIDFIEQTSGIHYEYDRQSHCQNGMLVKRTHDGIRFAILLDLAQGSFLSIISKHRATD